MAAQWNVDKNTGDRALLSNRYERKEVLRPKGKSAVFPSGVTSRMGPIMWSWLMEKPCYRDVAPGDFGQ